ncbi:hypothetical protein E2C01_001647 [Portunus trituberculatus]|uniref:Uncharacterized protein n=1 Tax=Portunus trituberculatus TaxID=210409 RepID=A0A5B7CIB0_PORTR|nr:hypothetical protein [Portunus trituberculatus]
MKPGSVRVSSTTTSSRFGKCMQLSLDFLGGVGLLLVYVNERKAFFIISFLLLTPTASETTIRPSEEEEEDEEEEHNENASSYVQCSP